MYTGVAELGNLTDEQTSALWENKYNEFGLLINQYVLAYNNDKIIKGKWTNSGLSELKYNKLKTEMFGAFSPKNTEQEFAFDALQNPNVTGVCLQGGFGSGKSILSLIHALYLLEKSKKDYKQIVFLRNNVITKNTFDVGALPDSLTEKIKPFAMMLADIIGDEAGLDRYISEKKISLDHLGFIRGRSFKDTIVYVSESQNITQSQMALIVSRIGEGSRLFVEGDISQCDKDVFSKESGLKALIDSLKGDQEFAVVTLRENVRSRFASLSDKVLNYKNNGE